MSVELMSEFLPASALQTEGENLGARFDGAFPDLDFSFAAERRAAVESVKKNLSCFIFPLSLSLIAADTVKDFPLAPTIIGGVIGGIGGFFWELADGSSAKKASVVKTEEGIVLTHDGSTFAELFVSTTGGILAGSSMGAGLTSGIDSKLAYALGLLGSLPGITLCRATKQRLWPLVRR